VCKLVNSSDGAEVNQFIEVFVKLVRIFDIFPGSTVKIACAKFAKLFIPNNVQDPSGSAAFRTSVEGGIRSGGHR